VIKEEKQRPKNWKVEGRHRKGPKNLHFTPRTAHVAEGAVEYPGQKMESRGRGGAKKVSHHPSQGKRGEETLGTLNIWARGTKKDVWGS